MSTITEAPSYPKALTILGREPAALLGLLEAILAALIAFGLGVTNDSAGAITAVVSAAIGIYTAWATKDTLLGAITGFTKALIALVIYYGIHLTEAQTAAVVVLVPLLIGYWQRGQTSPVANPITPSPQQVVSVPPTPDLVEGIEEQHTEATPEA